MRVERQIILIGIIFFLVNCGSKTYVLSTKYKDIPSPPVPDYHLANAWAALPDKLDAADSIPLNSNLKNEQASAKADVFFVHPTIFTEKPSSPHHWNADVNDADLNNKIQTSAILNQATIFNGSCRIYAPYYREAHLSAFYTTDLESAKASLDLAYEDVKSAFQYYLDHYNQGRPIVIASHSQGTYHAVRLLQEFFDGKELQKQLVAAYLVGRAVPASSFRNLKPSSNAEETGVWASWCTFGRNYLPATYEKYYKNSVSINPLLWNANEDFAPKELNKGGVGLKFTMYPHIVDAQNHQGVLWINKPYIKGRAFISSKNWHRADMNFFYNNIRENVAVRLEKFLRK